MIVAVDLSDLNTLTPELCKQLEQLLPLESRELLATPERLSSQDIRTIQAQLGHLWNGLSAMVPRWIVERIDTPAATAGRAAEATLLFADVTGFTPLTAQLEAFGRAGNEYLIDALNRFFAAIVPFALARGGDLLAFGGDAILVAFQGPGHAAAAVAAAWEMQQAIAALDLGDLGVPYPPRLQMKIGLATGPLVLADIGAETRRVALALGSVLDTTDAMANATAPGGIRLDSRAAAQAAAVARLAPQPDGSALLIELKDISVAPPADRVAASAADLDIIAARSLALGRYLPKSVLAALIAAPLAAPGSGEQRQVVSLFAHLTGLHELADALWDTQPGLVAAAANLVFNRVLAVIEGAGGVLARVDIYDGGHKLLALFGAPVAHEQAAARAVLTALTLPDALAVAGAEVEALLAGQLTDAERVRLGAAPAFGIRAGINAGLVVAGLVGSPLRWEYTVMGDAVNVAARLMGKAQPGETLASPQVRATLGERIDGAERIVQLKGLPAPMPAWSVHALATEEHSPAPEHMLLVGREAEQATFRQVGAALRSGQAAVVLVHGEAGIGKSRLVRELPAILGAEITHIQTGSPGLVPVSYGVLRSLLLQVCRLAQADPSAPALDELRPLVERLCPGRADELWPALAVLLGLAEADLAGLGATAEAQQRLLARALQALLEAAAALQPLAWVCEDLHEADDASLGVIEQLLAIGWQAPGLFCATLRTTAASAELARRLRDTAMRRFADRAIAIELGGLNPNAGDTLLDTLLPGLAAPTKAALGARGAPAGASRGGDRGRRPGRPALAARAGGRRAAGAPGADAGAGASAVDRA